MKSHGACFRFVSDGSLSCYTVVRGCDWTGLTSSNCNRPQWNRFVDQSSAGATRHSGPVSIQDCLDYCAETSNCVAVDVQVNIFPPGCCPHYSTSSLVDSNTFFLSGTNQYRLATRCSSQPAGTCINMPILSTPNLTTVTLCTTVFLSLK